jgi:hypothetical protein
MDFLEAHISLDAALDHFTHLIENEVGHEGGPFHRLLIHSSVEAKENSTRKRK